MRSLAKLLGLGLLGGTLTTIVAEFTFRACGDQPTLDLYGLYAPFEDGMYRLAANVNTTANWSSGLLTVHTDSLGLRCDQDRRLATKPGDAIEVLLLGDSQGFGNGVSFEDSLAGSLAMSANGRGYRVANASVGGHSAATQLRLAQWLREREKVKVSHYILLVTSAMIQSGGHLSRARVGNDGRLYGESTGKVARARTWAKTNLVIYARIRDALQNSGIGGEPTKELPFVFKFYEGGLAEQNLRRSFSDYVARLKEFAAGEGAQVHLVYVPLTLEMDFGSIKNAAAVQGLTIDPNIPLLACEAVAREHDVGFHNLKPVLKAFHDDAKPLHLKGDFHYNRELSIACGNQLWFMIGPLLSPPIPTLLPKGKPSHGE